MTAPKTRVAFIGFGEAAQAFVAGWAGKGPGAITAYDIKTDGAQREAMIGRFAARQVDGKLALADALEGAEVIFSTVTADQALVAAGNAARVLSGAPLFLDCNSCAPQTKQRSANRIEAAGGRYVDVAVMSPVRPKLHRTPMLVSGPHAGAAQAAMQALGMNAAQAEGEVGAASAIKLCRSIVVKGMEALTAELVLSMRLLGVEDPVLASLDKSYPGFDWARRAAYALERMSVHGERRAAEMLEAAVMIEALGLPARMANASADWQQQIGEMDLSPGEGDTWQQHADRILGRLKL